MNIGWVGDVNFSQTVVDDIQINKNQFFFFQCWFDLMGDFLVIFCQWMRFIVIIGSQIVMGFVFLWNMCQVVWYWFVIYYQYVFVVIFNGWQVILCYVVVSVMFSQGFGNYVEVWIVFFYVEN